MKPLLAAFLFFLIGPTLALAEPLLFEGVDIQPLVRAHSHQVLTLTQPVTIYSWSTAGRDPLYNPERSPDDPGLMGHAYRASRVFWTNFGSKEGANNMYGFGLYGAVDAVATRGYGGADSEWLLTQMRLPIGFRLIDVANPVSLPASPEQEAARDVAIRFHCPSNLQVDSLFQTGGSKLPDDCRRLTQKIFDDVLKIDGFAYSYVETQFKACSQDPSFSARAFVITRPDWIKPELVHFFNRASRQNIEDRIVIQTLFFKSEDENMSITPEQSQILVDFMIQHPDSDLKKSTSLCDGSQCRLTATFCDASGRCDDVSLGSRKRVGGSTITSTQGPLLWADLEGQPKSKTINTWLQQNKLACKDGTAPYASAEEHP